MKGRSLSTRNKDDLRANAVVIATWHRVRANLAVPRLDACTCFYCRLDADS